MPIRIKISTTPTELDGLFQARHQIFVEEERYLKTRSNKRIFDQFDAFPTTVNFIAMVDKQVVGGLRLTEQSEVGMPTDDFFDFSPFLPDGVHKIAGASMLCIQRDFRTMPRLVFVLLCMGIYWSLSRGISHVIAAINPSVKRVIRNVGFKPVSAVFHDDEHGVDVLPMVLDLNEVHDPFLEISKFRGFHDSLRTFDREIYRAGEMILRSGTEGDAAYIIADGKVNLSRPGRRANDPHRIILSELGLGDIFGELALLINQPQSTDVVALTDVDLMVIERNVFRAQLRSNSDLQLKLLELLGRRFVDTMERVSEK